MRVPGKVQGCNLAHAFALPRAERICGAFLFCFAENVVFEVRSPWWRLLRAPHFSYFVIEQFSVGHEGDPQMLPNLYDTSLGFETFGEKEKKPNPKMPFTPRRNFPVLLLTDISYTPDFQHSIFLVLGLKRARIPAALNADGLGSFVVRKAQKAPDLGDRWETCAAFPDISLISFPGSREAAPP